MPVASAIEWHVLTPDLKFRRGEDGKIIMRLGGEQTYITAERWENLVAALRDKYGEKELGREK